MSQRLRSSALAAAFVVPAVFYRLAALAAGGRQPGSPDLPGFASDLAVGLGLAALGGVLARFNRVAVTGVVAVWILACAGNYEHVRTLDANVAFGNLRHLANREFILGSLPGVDWLVLAAALALAAIPTWVALRDAEKPPGARAVAAAALSALVLSLVWSRNPASLRWRQQHFLPENLLALADRRAPGESDAVATRAAGDLSGESWLPAAPRARNVLWLILEGVSAAHVAPLAQAQRWESSYEMPALSALSAQSVAFTNFLTQQRQTNRGLYAMLCGDLPRLDGGTPRMSEYAREGGEPCLPARLAEAGYATAFVQAAPLGFMMKDQFMPRAGFERTVGAEHFRQGYRRSRWGVDDRAFFERSLEIVDEFQRAGRPWFVALLTSGTHHPYNVPDSFESRFPSDSHRHAAAYLDRAVGEFVDALRARSLLDDTLLLITSDESAGAAHATDPRAEEWSQNWGLALLFIPGAAPHRIATPHAQFDLPLSMLDYLGLSGERSPFSGRSVFRRYGRPRTIPFANSYLHRVAALARDDRLHTCDRGESGCRAWGIDRLRPFAPGARALGEEPMPPDLREALERSRAPLRPSGERLEFALLRPGTLPLESESEGFQWILGGQHFTVPPATRIEVSLDLRLVGVGGSAGFLHDLASEGRSLFRREWTIEAGQRLELVYARSAAEALPDTVVRLWTRPDRPPSAGLSLEVLRAEVRLMPASRPVDGRAEEFELLRFEISDPAGAPGSDRR